MMQIIYHLIVLYVTIHLIWFVIRENPRTGNTAAGRRTRCRAG